MANTQKQSKKQKAKTQDTRKILSYRSLPGTLSGRLDEIESHFAAALTGIEEELERTPESEKGLLKFLKALQQRAVFGEFKIEDYRCYKLGTEDGTVFEYCPADHVRPDLGPATKK